MCVCVCVCVYNVVCLFGAVLGLCCCFGSSLVAASRATFLVVLGHLTAAASLVAETGSRACGLQQLQIPDSRAQA